MISGKNIVEFDIKEDSIFSKERIKELLKENNIRYKILKKKGTNQILYENKIKRNQSN